MQSGGGKGGKRQSLGPVLCGELKGLLQNKPLHQSTAFFRAALHQSCTRCWGNQDVGDTIPKGYREMD